MIDTFTLSPVRSMKIHLVPALLATCAVATSLSAQAGVDPLSIPSGTHARVMERDGKNYIKLTVVNATRDSLRYQLDNDPASKSMNWQRVGKMDVSRGRHRHFIAGAAIGLVAGAAIGAITGSATASGNDGFTPNQVGALEGIMGAIVGTVAGGVIGIVTRTESWAPVSIPHPNPLATNR